MTRPAAMNDFHTASMVLLIAASAALAASSTMNVVEAQLTGVLTPKMPPLIATTAKMASVDEDLWRERPSEPAHACPPLQDHSCGPEAPTNSHDPTTMTFSMDRQTFSRLLDGGHNTHAGGHFRPVYKKGRVVGYKALKVSRGSFLSAVCIQRGDVIVTLNQHAVEAISAGSYPADLLNTDRLTIGIERGGLPHAVDIFIE